MNKIVYFGQGFIFSQFLEVLTAKASGMEPGSSQGNLSKGKENVMKPWHLKPILFFFFSLLVLI